MLQKGDKQLMAAMQKVFKCLSCQKDIRLERKLDNTGWIKYNLDGSKHADVKKSKQQLQQPQSQAATVDSGPRIAALSEQVKELKETVNILISKIQLLRSEVKNTK
jgi:hypothetical protein